VVIRAEVAKAADAVAIEIDRRVLRHTSQMVAAGQALAEAQAFTS
jgi:predicted regulator of amino acid metabolism with ACT domain